jgi:hypothetical protein
MQRGPAEKHSSEKEENKSFFRLHAAKTIRLAQKKCRLTDIYFAFGFSLRLEILR